MFDVFPYRIRLRRVASLHRSEVASRQGGKKRLALASAALAIGATCLSMAPAFASSGPFSATITTVTFSLTVSPSSGTFGSCVHGNSNSGALGFPNASCSIAGITITNLSTASVAHINVQGADAIPSDSGTHWTLAPNFPGTDQFNEVVVNGLAAHGLINSPTCDAAFNPSATDHCSAAPNQAATEELDLLGPSASTDSSSTFTTTVTWIAGT